MEQAQSMSQEMKVNLKMLMIDHEGKKEKLYFDTEGHGTIGIGRNVSQVGLRDDEIDLLFKNDSGFFYENLSKSYPWFLELNEARQIAIISMAFMGLQKFKTFKRMIAALDKHDYQMAAIEILDSNYGRKLTRRANHIANIILQGKL